MIKTIRVEATRVSNRQVWFKCPYCFSRYKKDGTPYKNAKRVEHVHGCDSMQNHNVGTRVPHCLEQGRKQMERDGVSEVDIFVVDETKRV